VIKERLGPVRDGRSRIALRLQDSPRLVKAGYRLSAGKVTANHMMRDFRAAYNLALRIIDDPDLLPDNPVKAVTFNKERSSNRVIMPEDLPHSFPFNAPGSISKIVQS